MTDIPDWAWKMLDNQIDWNAPDTCIANQARRIAARYIAEHEQPPVDPLLIEAREIAANNSAYDRKDIMNGLMDNTYGVPIILIALKRGIEIGKGER